MSKSNKILIVIATGILTLDLILRYKTRFHQTDSLQNLSKIQTKTMTPLLQKTDTQEATQTPAQVNQIVKTYTMEEVYKHSNDPNNDVCWTVIHGKVYDITEYAAKGHPGGEVIYDACGVDATKLFETRPMGSKTPHSAEARKILDKYYIGDLKQ